MGRSNHSATPAQPRPIIAMSCCRRRASAAPASLREPLPACAPQQPSRADVTININVSASAEPACGGRAQAQAPPACAACSLGPENAPDPATSPSDLPHARDRPANAPPSDLPWVLFGPANPCDRPHARARPARAPASATAKASACAPRDLTERVFIAPNGIKYHTRFGCSGAIGEMLLTQARARGYSPCKKCT